MARYGMVYGMVRMVSLSIHGWMDGCVDVCVCACACVCAGVCANHLNRCKTSFFGIFPCFVCTNLKNCRGHRPIVDTCANEAIPQWGKRRLSTSVYLQFSNLSSMATG